MSNKAAGQKRQAGAARASRRGAAKESNGVRHELLAVEVLDKAATLFASQGFAATSLQHVADAVGLSRSSIYYYYPSKDALLGELIRGVTLPVADIFREVRKQELSPRLAIQEVVRRLVVWVADPRTHFRLMDQSEAELPEAIAKEHGDAKRHMLSEMIKLIKAAVVAGEARPVDPRVAALSIIGMALWTAWWFQPEHGQSLEEVARLVAENAMATLQRLEPTRTAATVADLTQQIRDNLTLIETMTGGAEE